MNRFVAGTIARAADVNENFDELVALLGVTFEMYGAIGDGASHTITAADVAAHAAGTAFPWAGAYVVGTDQIDAIAIQEAINAVSRANGGSVNGTAGKNYYVDRNIDIPKNFSTRTQLRIHGNGCKITAKTGSAISIFRRLPTDNTEALGTMIDLTVVIDGITFVGDGVTASQKGVFLGATYGSAIRDCHFVNLDTALELRFCLMAVVESCRASNCRTSAFFASIGNWTGANYANSASNHTNFRNCRVYAAAGATSSFYVGGSTGCAVDDCIAEGGNTVDNVKYDALSSTNTVYFRVRNLHSENSPSGAVVRLIPNGGRMVVDGIYHQSTGVTLVDDTGTAGGSILEVTVPYIAATNKFKAGGSHWIFRYTGSLGTADLSNAATYWVGSVLPGTWSHERINGSGGAFPEFQGSYRMIGGALQVNGNSNDSAGNRLLTTRQTGLANLTGVAGLTTWDTETATLLQVARRLKTIDDMLKAHGLIST